MNGYLALVLHAHLPFVRHPEHPRFLEEAWFFEAITESYLPLLSILNGWERDGVTGRITLTLTPTLCAMLRDSLLGARYEQHLASLIDLAEKEVLRTTWDKALHEVAVFNESRLLETRRAWAAAGGDLIRQFRRHQEQGRIEIITSAATHALLPFLAAHFPSLRAQVMIARDDYRECFGREPRGIWLPECAYSEEIEPVLAEANLRWFILDSHGLLNARPRPRYGVYAPVFTRSGLAAFGRDQESARQVWSRHEGYPGDPRYREFYRDAGFDLDFDYVRPYLATADQRGFTGIKYHRITGKGPEREVYDRALALQAVAAHAGHFVSARKAQLSRLFEVMNRPPIVVAPYDAELFGHWWFEGPEFLDAVVRGFSDKDFALTTPGEYLRLHPTQQVAAPAASSWGEEGFWKMWLNETNHWIYQHLNAAQRRMSELAARTQRPSNLQERALRQAARELLLAQSSDWPFILRTGTSANYAHGRLKDHLRRFTQLYEQLESGVITESLLRDIEERDNLFPNLDFRYWQQLPGAGEFEAR